jgi:hypothetical protein
MLFSGGNAMNTAYSTARLGQKTGVTRPLFSFVESSRCAAEPSRVGHPGQGRTSAAEWRKAQRWAPGAAPIGIPAHLIRNKQAIKRLLQTALFAVVFAGAVVITASADDGNGAWPVRPVKVIVPVGAGSAPDAVARLVGDGLRQR